jgi:hypothetical protein
MSIVLNITSRGCAKIIMGRSIIEADLYYMLLKPNPKQSLHVRPLLTELNFISLLRNGKTLSAAIKIMVGKKNPSYLTTEMGSM